MATNEEKEQLIPSKQKNDNGYRSECDITLSAVTVKCTKRKTKTEKIDIVIFQNLWNANVNSIKAARCNQFQRMTNLFTLMATLLFCMVMIIRAEIGDPDRKSVDYLLWSVMGVVYLAIFIKCIQRSKPYQNHTEVIARFHRQLLLKNVYNGIKTDEYKKKCLEFANKIISSISQRNIESIFNYMDVMSFIVIVDIMDTHSENGHYSYFELELEDIYDMIYEPIKIWKRGNEIKGHDYETKWKQISEEIINDL